LLIGRMAHCVTEEESTYLLTPEMFAAHLTREPPERLELPDRVELAGASLAAFLESSHFPFGRYRVGEQQFFVTPSPQLEPTALETLARSGPGQQRVGQELLVCRRASFHVAAGTASETREARPFVSPSGARAYLWLGRPLLGGPLVLRDANNVEERVPVPEGFSEVNTETGRHGEDSRTRRNAGASTGIRGVEVTEREEGLRVPSSPSRPVTPFARHPALRHAEEAFAGGEDRSVVERHLREVMRSPHTSGEVLAGAGRLWQAVGRPDIAGAAFSAALERGSIEGALGLSRLAESSEDELAAATRPLDAAVARNLRSPELHARYAELLERMGQELQAKWHRRQIEKFISRRNA
jgi:hypothetical protein